MPESNTFAVRISPMVLLGALLVGCASQDKRNPDASPTIVEADATAVVESAPTKTAVKVGDDPNVAQPPVERTPAATPVATAARRVNRVFTTVEGIADRDTRLIVLKAIELRALKRNANATEAQLRRLYRRAPKQITTSLEPLGYYQVKVKSTFEWQEDKYRALFTVDLGPKTKINRVDYSIEGAAATDKSVASAWKRVALAKGEDFDHERYENAKAEIQRILQQRGYLDAELVERRVEIKRAESLADIYLKWNGGVRYRYGTTRFEGGQFSQAFMERYLTYQEGDHYTQSKLLSMQQRMVDADYFSVIEIAPELEQSKDGVVPISVQLVPAKQSIYTYGLSYGTDSGAGVRAGLDRRWVNDRGHKLRSGAEFSQRRKSLAISYDIPRSDKYRTTYGLNLSYLDQETETSRSKLARVSAGLAREKNDWRQSLALQWLSGDFEVGGQDGSSTLFYPELILYKRQADDLLYPREGYAITISARAGVEALLSDTSFANANVEARYIHSLADNQRLLARTSLGAVYAQNFDALPPELRFFAGGDRSLRGYGYQELGPRNDAGLVSGGKYLAVISGEYEYALNETWAVAGFADVGNAFNAEDSQIKTGIGAGVRWRSPVGVVRIDVAAAIDEEDTPLRVHLIIGPDL